MAELELHPGDENEIIARAVRLQAEADANRNASQHLLRAAEEAGLDPSYIHLAAEQLAAERNNQTNTEAPDLRGFRWFLVASNVLALFAFGLSYTVGKAAAPAVVCAAIFAIVNGITFRRSYLLAGMSAIAWGWQAAMYITQFAPMEWMFACVASYIILFAIGMLFSEGAITWFSTLARGLRGKPGTPSTLSKRY